MNRTTRTPLIIVIGLATASASLLIGSAANAEKGRGSDDRPSTTTVNSSIASGAPTSTKPAGAMTSSTALSGRHDENDDDDENEVENEHEDRVTTTTVVGTSIPKPTSVPTTTIAGASTSTVAVPTTVVAGARTTSTTVAATTSTSLRRVADARRGRGRGRGSR